MNIMFRLLTLIIISMAPIYSNATIYLEEPKDFHPTIEAAGCLLEYENELLLLHRQNHKPQGNLWCAPGGKLDESESPYDAVIREIYEETGYDISKQDVQYLGKFYFRNVDGDYVFYAFECKFDEFPGPVQIAFKEHKGFTWVTPKDALDMHLMMDEDQLFQIVYNDQIKDEV